MTTQNEELAWAAGFFDGEGCVFVHCGGKNIAVEISQKARFVLDRFKTAIGCIGNVHGPYRRGINGKILIIYHYRASGIERVVRIMNKLVPYLSPVKLEQYYSAVETRKSYIINKGVYQSRTAIRRRQIRIYKVIPLSVKVM